MIRNSSNDIRARRSEHEYVRVYQSDEDDEFCPTWLKGDSFSPWESIISSPMSGMQQSVRTFMQYMVSISEQLDSQIEGASNCVSLDQREYDLILGETKGFNELVRQFLTKMFNGREFQGVYEFMDKNRTVTNTLGKLLCDSLLDTQHEAFKVSLVSIYITLPLKFHILESKASGEALERLRDLVLSPIVQISKCPSLISDIINSATTETSESCKNDYYVCLRKVNNILDVVRDIKSDDMVHYWSDIPKREQYLEGLTLQPHRYDLDHIEVLNSAEDLRVAGSKTTRKREGSRSIIGKTLKLRSKKEAEQALVHLRQIKSKIQHHCAVLVEFSASQHYYSTLWRKLLENTGNEKREVPYINSMYECYEYKTRNQLEITNRTAHSLRGLVSKVNLAIAHIKANEQALDCLPLLIKLVWQLYISIQCQWYSNLGNLDRRISITTNEIDIIDFYQQSMTQAKAIIRNLK